MPLMRPVTIASARLELQSSASSSSPNAGREPGSIDPMNTWPHRRLITLALLAALAGMP
jgi:hypothetical protein